MRALHTLHGDAPELTLLLWPLSQLWNRRRGELTGAMLSCLADDSWQQLDVAGCSKLYGAELLAAAVKLPRLVALDITGGCRPEGWGLMQAACRASAAAQQWQQQEWCSMQWNATVQHWQ